MAFNITPFKSTDEFTMAGFNGKISDINSGIGAYANEYWWKRRVNITSEGYVEKKTVVSGDVYIYNSSSQSSVNVTYSSNITVTPSGEISFNSPQTATRGYVATHMSEFLGKYVKNLIQSPSTVYFISSNAGYYETEEGTPMVNRYTSGVYSVTSEYVSTPTIGDWQYLHSPNRSAYPDSGISEGYEYQYLGVPFNNAVNANFSIVYGTYVGDGATTVRTINIGFTPTAVFVVNDRGTTFTYLSGVSRYVGGLALPDSPATDAGRTIVAITDGGFKVNKNNDSVPYVYTNNESVVYKYIALKSN